MKRIRVGTFKGRHPLPVEDYIFRGEIKATDFPAMEAQASEWTDSVFEESKGPVDINLYVTGLTAGTLAVISVCMKKNFVQKLVAFHYDREAGNYTPQIVFDRKELIDCFNEKATASCCRGCL